MKRQNAASASKTKKEDYKNVIEGKIFCKTLENKNFCVNIETLEQKTKKGENMIKHYMTKFIANSINFEDLQDLGYEVSTLKEVYFLEFGNYRGYNISSVKEWLQGLPSAITFPFYNADIIEGLGKVGLDVEKGDDYDLIDIYWLMLAKYFKDNFLRAC